MEWSLPVTFVLFFPLNHIWIKNVTIMKRCIYFFLGLLAALGLAVLMGSNTPDEKTPGLDSVLAEKTTKTDGLATDTPKKETAEFIPVKKKP